MSTKIKPHNMWALYNYGHLKVVEHYRSDLAKLFVNGNNDLLEGINRGAFTVHRVKVSVIRRIPKKRNSKS